MTWALPSVFPDAITARRSERTQRNLGIRKRIPTSQGCAGLVVVAGQALRLVRGVRPYAVSRKWSGVRGSNPHRRATCRYSTGSPLLRVSRSGTVQFGVQPRGAAKASSRRQTWLSNPSLGIPRRKPADPYISRPDPARNPLVLCIFFRVSSRVRDAFSAVAMNYCVRLPFSANARCEIKKDVRLSSFVLDYARRRTRLPFWAARTKSRLRG